MRRASRRVRPSVRRVGALVSGVDVSAPRPSGVYRVPDAVVARRVVCVDHVAELTEGCRDCRVAARWRERYAAAGVDVGAYVRVGAALAGDYP